MATANSKYAFKLLSGLLDENNSNFVWFCLIRLKVVEVGSHSVGPREAQLSCVRALLNRFQIMCSIVKYTKSMNKMPATLGYWKLRGLAQHIKYFLEYTGTEYNDKIYEHGPAPDFDGSQWTNEKYTLGLDFPNLPYYIDGERKITQSNAILRYIARKHDMDIKTEDEMIRLEMLENETVDLRMGFAKMCSNPDFEKIKADYISETMSIKIDQFSKFLGNPNWFLGEKVTFIDFFVYELLDCFRILEPSCLDKHDNLKKFMDRLESLEPIKKYMSSSRFIKAPLNGPMAYFGGK